MPNAFTPVCQWHPKGGSRWPAPRGDREPATCSVATGSRTGSRILRTSLGIPGPVVHLACPLDAVRIVTIRLVPRSPAATVPGRLRTMELLVGRDLLILLMLALGTTLVILGLRLTRP